MMNPELKLDEGEVITWEARPAPRCYTFRHWRHSLFGLVFLAICIGWQVMGIAMATEYRLTWISFLPLPFVLIGIYFSCGHLLQARLEWNNVAYVLTDRRLLARRGLFKPVEQSLPLSEITYFHLRRHGEQLGTLTVHKGQEQKIIMHCIEHPQRATDLLEETIKLNEARMTRCA